MSNWRKFPLLRILLPSIAGILLANYLRRPMPCLWYGLLGGGTLLAILAFRSQAFRYRWWSGSVIIPLFLLLGYACSTLHNPIYDVAFMGHLASGEQLVQGIVRNAPHHQQKRIQIELEVERVGTHPDTLTSVRANLLLYLPNDLAGQAVRYGDRLLCQTNWQPIAPPRNPHAFDYRGFLARRHIHHQAFIADGAFIRLDSLQGNPILGMAYQWRAQLLRALHRHLPAKEQQSVAAALILGYKQGLSEDVKNAYSATGAMHVLAVSGLHVGLVWAIIAFCLRWLPTHRPLFKVLRTLLTLMALWGFALLTGASPSVLRATTMFSFILVGRMLQREGSIYNTLAASAFCLLLFDPQLIFQIGFQLSYAAVASIVYFYPKIYPLWHINNRLGDWTWQLVALSIAAQLGTLPLSLYYFHQFPLYFWLSGIVVVPFAFLVLGSGLLMLFLDLIWPALAGLVAYLLNGLIWLMNALIFLIHQLPQSFFSEIWIDHWVMLALYLGLACMIIGINWRRARWWLYASGILVLISAYTAFRWIDQDRQRQLTIYDLHGRTYVEFVEGEEIIALHSKQVHPEDLHYATRNYHLSLGARLIEQYTFGEKIERSNWWLNQQFVQFHTLRLFIPAALPARAPIEPLKVDLLLLRDGFASSLDVLFEYVEPKQVIIDNSARRWQQHRWITDCGTHHVPVHRTATQGAFTLDLNDIEI